MLRNPRGATSLRWLTELLRAGVEVHGQVVVCPGVNDGAELERTLHDVVSLYPELASVALVPVGVSDFTDEESMRSHTPDEARRVVALAERFQRLTREIFGTRQGVRERRVLYRRGHRTSAAPRASRASTRRRTALDSWRRSRRASLRADVNGEARLGILPVRRRRSRARLSRPRERRGRMTTKATTSSVLTGEYAAPILRALFDEQGFTDVEVKAVKNRYFGGNIKVAGLMTGPDLSALVEGIPSHRLPCARRLPLRGPFPRRSRRSTICRVR